MTTTESPAPRKRHRIFWISFAIVQVIFLTWVIIAASTGAGTLEDFGVEYIVAFWLGADVILGIEYFFYRLARRGG